MTRSKQIRIILALIAFIATGIIIFYYPPNSMPLIISFIVAASAGSFLLPSVFLGYVRGGLISLFVALFLFMGIFIGFQVLNTILLACFIIGLDRLYTSFK